MLKSKLKKVELFTDGACSGNPGPGGWGAILRYGSHEKEFSGGESDTTNNRMELRAVIEGLFNLKEGCAVTVHTDSKYVMDGINKYIANWKAKGWKTSTNKPVKNQELWERLDLEIQRHKVNWVWVKGHNGHDENERADQLARDAVVKI